MARQADPPARVAAFFDVDNTVVRGASAFHIARGLRRRGYFRVRDIIGFAWEQAKYLIMGETDEQIDRIRNGGLSLMRGWSVAEMTAIGEEIYDEMLALRIFPGTKALIDEHLAQGHEVWFVTASPSIVGRIIAKRLGATGALGTELEHKGGYYTGGLVGDLLHGPAKALAVKDLAERNDLDLAASFAYGDSMNDVPMLSEVGHPCAINPDRRLRRHARTAGWPIEDFRGRKSNGRKSILRSSATGFAWVLMAVLRGLKYAVLRPFRRRSDATTS